MPSVMLNCVVLCAVSACFRIRECGLIPTHYLSMCSISGRLVAAQSKHSVAHVLLLYSTTC